MEYPEILLSILLILFPTITYYILNKRDNNVYNSICVYDNVLPKELCQEIIKKFDKDERKYKGLIGVDKRVNVEIKDTTDLCISKLEDWKDIDNKLCIYLNKMINKYMKNLNNNFKNLNIQIDGKFEDDGYKVQKYLQNEGEYKWHDDKANKTRILTFLWYLNDVKEGGETEFVDGTKVKPKTGRICIFPATWLHIHRGCMPISSDKYICNGWIYRK